MLAPPHCKGCSWPCSIPQHAPALGKPSEKSTFLSDIVQKGGVQPESKSFEVVFALIFGNYWNVGPIKKLPHSCPKWADKKVTSRMFKTGGGGVEATFGQCPKERFFSF